MPKGSTSPTAPSTPESSGDLGQKVDQLRDELFKVQRGIGDLQMQIRRVLENVTAAGARSPRPTQALHMRIVFQPVLTELVRAVRFQELPADEMRIIATNLEERFGKPAVDDAMAELLEATPAGLWRLSHEARTRAHQVIDVSSDASGSKDSRNKSGFKKTTRG